MNLEAANAKKLTHEAAWKLVCPTRRGAHWKDEVNQVVTNERLKRSGLTISQVIDAVAFYTATIPTVEPAYFFEHPIGYLVTAPGYRRGPAGDG